MPIPNPPRTIRELAAAFDAARLNLAEHTEQFRRESGRHALYQEANWAFADARDDLVFAMEACDVSTFAVAYDGYCRLYQLADGPAPGERIVETSFVPFDFAIQASGGSTLSIEDAALLSMHAQSEAEGGAA